MYFTRKLSLISGKLLSHLLLFTIGQWQSFILQREVPHPSTIKSTNSPFCVPTLPLFCLCFYLRPTLSFNLFLMDCYLKEFMLSWFFFFPPCCVTSSPSFKKKKILKHSLLVVACRFLVATLHIATKIYCIQIKKKYFQEQSLQFFNKTTMIP